MRSKRFEGNIIIAINTMRKIMDIFLGPFLTAYFIKTSQDTLNDISIYYICSYIILALITFIVASIIKSKFRIGMFRIGVILNFIYIMTIIVLNKNIVNHLGLVSILYGLSAGVYWFPYNLFVINKVDNCERTKFTVRNQIASSITGIICPILLGSIISVTNYELTAVIILIVSIIQIALSFLLTKENEANLVKFNIVNTWKKLKNNNQIRKMSIVEFFIGMNVSGGALEILKTILIFNSFKTNMNLGIITSITTIIAMFFIHLYGRFYKHKNDKNIILISCILPVISVLILLVIKNSVTLVIYNICYVIFTSLLSLMREIRLYNIADSEIVDKNSQCEYFTIREIVLNLGRIFGFILLLIAGFSGNENILNVIIVVLTLSILVMGVNLRKVDKFEK